MKIRSSHVVVLLLALMTAIIALIILRSFKPGEGAAETTDQFLQEVEQIRAAGHGSAETAGIVKSTVVDISKRPKIEFTVENIDMGIIPRTEKSFARTPVKNTGDSPLEIGQIATTCGCTLGDFENSVTRADGSLVTIVPPGGQVDLIISVDPALVKGFFADKVLTLHSNDPVTPKASLLVKSRVDPEYTIEPGNGDMDFGRIPKGSDGETRTIIRQATDEPLDITGVNLSTAANTPSNTKGMTKFITMEVLERPEEQWKTAGRAEWEIVARVSPEAPAGPIYEVFTILSTAPRVPTFEATLEGSVLSFYNVSPLNLGAREPVKPGQQNIAAATIISQFPVEITEVAVTGADLEVAVSAGENTTETLLQLNVKPDAASGMKNEHVTFRVTGSGQMVEHRMRAFASVEAAAP
ncbi:MAG: DUF1573 domain-containing protein [Candidatus Hydrogenedentes bacterium]|nr:DUF1573 domain-containing protein [Candidatus Hydrogenedentota bacterium]